MEGKWSSPRRSEDRELVAAEVEVSVRIGGDVGGVSDVSGGSDQRLGVPVVPVEEEIDEREN